MNNTDYPTAIPISFYDYEQKLQDDKTKIRLVQPRFINQFVEEFETVLGE